MTAANSKMATFKEPSLPGLIGFCLVLLIFNGAAAGQDGYKTLEKSLKSRYDGQVLVVVRDELLAGEFQVKELTQRQKPALSYFYFDASLTERPKRVSVGQMFLRPVAQLNPVDDQTLYDLTAGLNVTKLTKGEQFRVTKVDMSGNTVELLLQVVDPSHLKDLDATKAIAANYGRDVRVAGFGTRMVFYFDRKTILDAGDQKSVEQAIGRFLVPRAEADKVLAEQNTIEIQPGESEDSVIAKLGTPLKIIKLGSDKILKFKDLTVTFKDGKVADVKVE